MPTIICTGSRNWSDYAFILSTLRGWHHGLGITLLVHGDCRGADTLCARAAGELQIPVLAYPADWAQMGLGAGPQRNRQMVHRHSNECAAVLAFHDHIVTSKGTADMVRVSVRMGKPVVLYSHSGVEFL